MRSRMLKRAIQAVLLLGLCVVAAFMVSARGASAEGRHDEDRRDRAGRFEVDCTRDLSAPAFTCDGDLVEKAALTDVNHFGAFLGSDGSGGGCALSSSTDTLTARDGSTLTLSTHGLICFEATPGFAVRHNAYLIEGGTGRFAGALGTGTFTMSSENPAIQSLHIDGTVSVPED
jgi:hypothetical protein